MCVIYISQNPTALAPGDPYKNFLLSALVEIPGYTLGYICMEKIGRRVTVCITLIICGLSLISDALLEKLGDAQNPSIEHAKLATFLIGISFLYLLNNLHMQDYL